MIDNIETRYGCRFTYLQFQTEVCFCRLGVCCRWLSAF